MKKLAVITGATSGIGEAFAYELARDHDHIWLVGRRAEQLQKVQYRLKHEFSVAADVLILDLAQPEKISQLAQAMQTQPALATLVNNAGYAQDGRYHEMPWQEHEDLMTVHIQATIRLTYAALKVMVSNGRGAIINVASVASWIPTPKSPLYGPTKAFIRSFSESLAADYRSQGIRIQGLCPGFTVTDFHSKMGLDPAKAYKKSGLTKAWSSQFTARASLRDLEKGKVVSVPGWNYKLLTALIRCAPHQLLGSLASNRSHRRGMANTPNYTSEG